MHRSTASQQSRPFFIMLAVFALFLLLPAKLSASTLSVRPVTGTFTVGSVFDVSVLLDTKGKSVNVVKLSLSFPADKLQITSPSTGKSIIDTWTASPKFDNATGRVELEGGIKGGINASEGLITTLSFRVKSVGEAIIKFLDDSRVLLNDGHGTDDLSQTQNGIYELTLPPPGGPIVVSETHPSQFIWYSNRTLVLRWENEESGVQGYSYMLSDDPTATPDDISEGTKTSVAYGNLSDGIHYFHIKSLRDGKWGGITHFSAKIDASPPANFPVYVSPSARTASKQPIIQFITTDALSGVDHYEIKIIALSPDVAQKPEVGGQFFIETGTSYIPSVLELGDYDILVRAYDKADNFKEVEQRLAITTPIFEFVGEKGLIIGNFATIPWKYLYGVSAVILLGLGFGAYKVRRWRKSLHAKTQERTLPRHVLDQLEELKAYRKKYGLKSLIVIFAFLSLLSFHSTHAEGVQLSPPIISNVSQNISNEEIFYVSGQTDFAETEVVIYLQNLKTGETLSQNLKSDKNGAWFYHHPSVLSPGDYIIWTQGKLGDELSPPGPQTKMSVKRTAVQFGFSRLSYETMYLFTSIGLFLGILGLLAYIILHSYHARRKYKEFQVTLQEAEESVRRGFAVLKHDVEAELAVIHRAKLTGALSVEEKEKEEHLLKDLDTIQKRIGKEIWEIEHSGYQL